MFESLTERLSGTLRALRGRGRLSEENIQEALREVRRALLEADVAISVVADFMGRVREQALGQSVLKSLTPGQELVRVVRDELTSLIDSEDGELRLGGSRPAVILVAGLQGSGKTTTVGKLGLWLKERQRKSVMMVSCDIYRPAAIEQLRILSEQAGALFRPSQPSERPVEIASAAKEAARAAGVDVLVVDTAGRLHVDAGMMDEARALSDVLAPSETLFVVDSMTGQDAVQTAKAFDETLPLTGVVLTKTDGDARGGAALSVRSVTGKPIKFLGTGEKLEGLEQFHAERVVSRILGMGDVLTLIEEAERTVDREHAERLARKIKKGKGFDLDDFREQLRQMRRMGGLGTVMEKLPGLSELPAGAAAGLDDREVVRMEAIIDSMTAKERRTPAIIKGSRKRRIAAGSGTRIQDVNRLLKQIGQMQKMMKRMRKRGGLDRMMQAMTSQPMPPGVTRGRVRH